MNFTLDSSGLLSKGTPQSDLIYVDNFARHALSEYSHNFKIISLYFSGKGHGQENGMGSRYNSL